MPSAKFFGILLALILAIIVSNTSNAATITFNENGIGPGSLISDQYASQGLIFSTVWSTSPAPGYVQSNGCFQLYNSSAGLYLKFTVPIYSFAASVFEFPLEPEPEPNPELPPPEPPSAPPPLPGGDPSNLPPTGGEQPSVYAGLFRLNNNVYQQMILDQVTGRGNTEDAGNNELVVHAEGTWRWLGFTSETPVDGLWIHNPDLNFYIGSIYYSQTPAPVPVPSSLILLVFGLIGLAAYGRNFKTA